ncbi:MAG: YbaN family protein [Sphingobium sp.]
MADHPASDPLPPDAPVPPKAATPEPAPPEPALRHGRAVRVGWLILGLCCVVLGIIGAFLPLMPTTIFLILAAGCFTHSSPRLEAWLLNHPRHGPALRAWRAEGAIPRRGKQAACLGMAVGYVLFWLLCRPGLLLASGVAAALIACAAWIITRPLPRASRRDASDAREE